MSGRTAYIGAIGSGGGGDGSPTNRGGGPRPPRPTPRRRNGIRPCVRASSSTPRESPSICTTSSRRRPAVGAHPRRARRIRRSTKRWSPSTRSSRGIGALYYPIRDEPGAERRRRRAPLRRAGGASGRPGARARRRLPARARRAHARARPLRRPRAARVRRPRPRRHHLRARHRGAVPRLDVAGRRDQQPHDGRADRAPPRHRGAARALAAPLRRRRGARRPLPHRAARGLDVQAILTRARRVGEEDRISGTKMFVTNGREGNTFALLAVTDPGAQPRHRGMSCFIVEKGGAGLTVVKSIGKLGYKGVDTAELLFEDFACPAANLVGGVEGRGFGQVMSGLEAGRINIAARAVGVAQAAFEEAAARGAGAPRLDDMAARVEAARLLTHWAAGMKDRAERCGLEAGMAKLFASETAHEVALDAVRLCGTSTALAIERCYRDTPLMIIGEGTNEIQRTIIARQLVERSEERRVGKECRSRWSPYH